MDRRNLLKIVFLSPLLGGFKLFKDKDNFVKSREEIIDLFLEHDIPVVVVARGDSNQGEDMFVTVVDATHAWEEPSAYIGKIDQEFIEEGILVDLVSDETRENELRSGDDIQTYYQDKFKEIQNHIGEWYLEIYEWEYSDEALVEIRKRFVFTWES